MGSREDDLREIADLMDAGELPTAPDVVTIFTDEKRGHIVILPEEGQLNGQPVSFVDLGPVLHLWTGQGCTLTPDLADQLADELHAWARRKQRAEVCGELADDDSDVFCTMPKGHRPVSVTAVHGIRQTVYPFGYAMVWGRP